MKTSVYIADAFPLTRKALKLALEEKDFKIVGEGISGPVVEREILDLKPDLATLSHALPKRDGLVVAERIMAKTRTPKIIFFTESADADKAIRAMQLGVPGYVLQTEGVEGVLKCALELLLSDGLSYCQETLDIVASHIRANGRRVPLSERERDIVGYLANGLSVKRVGQAMNLAEDTIKLYLKNAYEKLGVHTQAGAVAEAFRHKIIK